MKVVVCVKQIPDPNTTGQLDPTTHLLKRDGVEVVLDPGDEFGVEAGLQLVDAQGGDVTVVSMGPERGLDAVRKALAMGAGKGVLISDDGLRGSDALTTARVLAAAIRREGFDLVITATESTDGYTGVVPQMIAELLDVPAVTFAKTLEVDGTTLKVKRQTEAGLRPRRGRPPGCRQRHRRRQRAALPVAEGNHGSQVEAARPDHARGPRSRRRRRRNGRPEHHGRGARGAACGRVDRQGRRRGLQADRRLPCREEGDLTGWHWERSGSSRRWRAANPRPVALELLTKARSLAVDGRGRRVRAGRRGRGGRAGRARSHNALRRDRPALGRAPARRPGRRRARGAHRGAQTGSRPLRDDLQLARRRRPSRGKARRPGDRQRARRERHRRCLGALVGVRRDAQRDHPVRGSGPGNRDHPAQVVRRGAQRRSGRRGVAR